jgi:hypothetical protein
MNAEVFIDTNILLYTSRQRSSSAGRARGGGAVGWRWHRWRSTLLGRCRINVLRLVRTRWPAAIKQWHAPHLGPHENTGTRALDNAAALT